jgi:dihydrofolate reductase
MRKIIVSNMVSLDCFIAGPGGELDWHVVDDEFNKYGEDMLNSADTILFGRVTYEMMASYWPTPAAIEDDPLIAAGMNSISKIVFSKTLDKVDWENATVVTEDLAGKVKKLKAQPGKDILILGSGSIVAQLTEVNLIDEFRMIINPVILGDGKPQFNKNLTRKKLQLTDIRQLASGVVILYYQTIK